MVGSCPHCGRPIEMVPTTRGETLVVDIGDKAFAIVYDNGYAVRKSGRLIHDCRKTGEDGHVVR